MSPATLSILWEVWVMGEVTPTGGFLLFLKLPGWPKLWGFFSSPLPPKSSLRLGGFFLHLLGASVLRLPESKLELPSLWVLLPSSLYQESPLSTRERFSASVRSCRERKDTMWATIRRGLCYLWNWLFSVIFIPSELHSSGKEGEINWYAPRGLKKKPPQRQKKGEQKHVQGFNTLRVRSTH